MLDDYADQLRAGLEVFCWIRWTWDAVVPQPGTDCFKPRGNGLTKEPLRRASQRLLCCPHHDQTEQIRAVCVGNLSQAEKFSAIPHSRRSARSGKQRGMRTGHYLFFFL